MSDNTYHMVEVDLSDIEVEIEITENSTGSGGENADVPSDEEDSE